MPCVARSFFLFSTLTVFLALLVFHLLLALSQDSCLWFSIVFLLKSRAGLGVLEDRNETSLAIIIQIVLVVAVALTFSNRVVPSSFSLLWMYSFFTSFVPLRLALFFSLSLFLFPPSGGLNPKLISNLFSVLASPVGRPLPALYLSLLLSFFFAWADRAYIGEGCISGMWRRRVYGGVRVCLRSYFPRDYCGVFAAPVQRTGRPCKLLSLVWEEGLFSFIFVFASDTSNCFQRFSRLFFRYFSSSFFFRNSLCFSASLAVSSVV